MADSIGVEKVISPCVTTKPLGVTLPGSLLLTNMNEFLQLEMTELVLELTFL